MFDVIFHRAAEQSAQLDRGRILGSRGMQSLQRTRQVSLFVRRDKNVSDSARRRRVRRGVAVVRASHRMKPVSGRRAVAPSRCGIRSASAVRSPVRPVTSVAAAITGQPSPTPQPAGRRCPISARQPDIRCHSDRNSCPGSGPLAAELLYRTRGLSPARHRSGRDRQTDSDRENSTPFGFG